MSETGHLHEEAMAIAAEAFVARQVGNNERYLSLVKETQIKHYLNKISGPLPLSGVVP